MLERKKLKSRNHGVPEFFLVRYRRTYLLNNYVNYYESLEVNLYIFIHILIRFQFKVIFLPGFAGFIRNLFYNTIHI